MATNLIYSHLSNFYSPEGYWSNTDCKIIAKDILSLTGASKMLEIGFNIGYSASVWLEQGINELAVIDINNYEHTVPALYAVQKAYEPKKVYWLLCDSKSEQAKQFDSSNFDIAFIDGEHTYDAAYKDSILSINYGCKWLVYDDVIEDHPNGIYDAIIKLEEEQKIEIVKTYFMSWVGNGYVTLCRVL